MDGLAARALAGLMLGSGVGHVVAPDYFRELVPSWVPAPSAVVPASGLADVGAGVLVARPATRRAGGWATAALITAYLPAHLDPIRRAGTVERAMDRPLGIAARIVVYLGFVACADSVARRS